MADRSNARVQIFDAQGRFITEWNNSVLGRPYAVAIGPAAKAYVIDGGDQPANAADRSRAFRLARHGTIEAVFVRFGNYDGQFRVGHDITVSQDGAVYIVDA